MDVLVVMEIVSLPPSTKNSRLSTDAFRSAEMTSFGVQDKNRTKETKGINSSFFMIDLFSCTLNESIQCLLVKDCIRFSVENARSVA